MEVDRRSLALQNRQISIRMEQLTDRMVERTGLSTAQAHLLMRILAMGRRALPSPSCTGSAAIPWRR